MKSSYLAWILFMLCALPVEGLLNNRGNNTDVEHQLHNQFGDHRANVSILSLIQGGLRSEATVVHKNVTETISHWHVVYVLALLMLIAIIPVAQNHGFGAFVLVVTYLAALTLVKIFVKQAMNAGYSYPYSITAMHMAATAAVAVLVDRPRMAEALYVLPISMVNGLGLALNNTSLAYGGVAFCSMINSCTPATTFGLEVSLGRREVTQGLLSILLVCLGGALCVQGETVASLACFILSGSSTLCRSLKSVWQHQLLETQIPAIRMVFWSGFWSLLGMLPLLASKEGMAAFRALANANDTVRWALGLSIVCATALNVCQVFALKALGPLMQTVIGNLNLIMVVALSAAMLHEDVSPLQYAGVLSLVAGAVTTKAGGSSKQANLKCKQDEAEVIPFNKEKAKEYGAGV